MHFGSPFSRSPACSAPLSSASCVAEFCLSIISDESRATVDRTIRVIVTLAALVLGLLVASAKGSYDAISDKLQEISADVILLDHTMAQYGPETREARELLRRATVP